MRPPIINNHLRKNPIYTYLTIDVANDTKFLPTIFSNTLPALSKQPYLAYMVDNNLIYNYFLPNGINLKQISYCLTLTSCKNLVQFIKKKWVSRICLQYFIVVRMEYHHFAWIEPFLLIFEISLTILVQPTRKKELGFTFF